MTVIKRRSPFALILVFAASLAIPARAQLPEAPPAALGLDPIVLAGIDGAVQRAVDDGEIPGAVVLVARHGQVAYVRAFGHRALVPAPEPMTRQTRFDLASLTKPVATATAIMRLIDKGRLSLSDPLTKHLPEFDQNGKGSITVEQLLRHRAGLIADNALSDYAHGEEEAWQNLAALTLESEPGTRFRYSDVGFLILGRLVERLEGRGLGTVFADEIATPLGLTHSGFPGLDPDDVSDFAPTEPAAKGEPPLRGVVHDPRSRAIGGVAGHAGLFGTADDLAVYAQMLLDGGSARDGTRILNPRTAQAMINPGSTPPGQKRGLGWDIETPYGAPRGRLFGENGFGHTGFTGTSLWVDPPTGMIVVILTSRLHPDGGSTPNRLRREVATLAAAAIVESPFPTEKPGIDPVSCGVDVLEASGFEALKGKRIGLVTNHTGLTRDGRTTIDLLHKAPGVDLAALFSPEHGIRGLVDREVADDRDEATGLVIHSLYGKTRKPTPESLQGLDAIVYDIQDIGVRYYTYISTLGLVLDAAREADIEVVVLDRPNPLGGLIVEGPLRDPQFESFIAHHALPIRHGMTVGELALMFNAQRDINANLTVIPCDGWTREDPYDRTGLLWVNPSPNMRSLTEAILYPGVGWLEATNLATGRGTDTPFERVGAPFIDPRAWSEALNSAPVPGVRFLPVRFTPTERQFAGQECGGVYIMLTNRAALRPVDLGLTMALTLRQLYPDHWQPDKLRGMLANQQAFDAIHDAQPATEIHAAWNDQLAEYQRARWTYLLYR